MGDHGKNYPFKVGVSLTNLMGRYPVITHWDLKRSIDHQLHAKLKFHVKQARYGAKSELRAKHLKGLCKANSESSGEANPLRGYKAELVQSFMRI